MCVIAIKKSHFLCGKKILRYQFGLEKEGHVIKSMEITTLLYHSLKIVVKNKDGRLGILIRPSHFHQLEISEEICPQQEHFHRSSHLTA